MVEIIYTRQLSKAFAHRNGDIRVLSNVNLSIEKGSFVAFVGPSGCGKSTFLNIVAGLVTATTGGVFYKGEPIVKPRVEVGYLTQKDTLMPWLNLERNIEVPLEIRGVEAKVRHYRVAEFIQMVGLKGYEKLYPHELSGGMLRRAGLARMLVTEPETLLLDEPFAALDAQLRLDLQNELLALWAGSGKSVMFVTHDLEEAVILADRVVVLGKGGRTVHDERIMLPRPRDAARIRFQPEFAMIHHRLWDALMEARTQVQEASI